MILVTEYSFEERTSSGCVLPDNGLNKAISGYQSKNGLKTVAECKLDCKKYEWCRGIRVANPELTEFKYCRLLTNHSLGIEGWKFFDIGNWAEPHNWESSTEHFNTLRCLEKIKISMFKILYS